MMYFPSDLAVLTRKKKEDGVDKNTNGTIDIHENVYMKNKPR